MGTATTALAGCDHLGDDDSTPPEDVPDVTLQDVRVVQNVEDSELRRGSAVMPDPPIVAGEYATVMFDVDVTHDENLPDIVPVSVTSPQTNFDYTQQVSKTDLQSMNGRGDAPAVFDTTAKHSGSGEAPHLQKMPADIDEITVKILHQYINGDEVTLVEGVNCDFRVRELQPLRVAFINVKDPGDAQSPEFSALEAQQKGKNYTTDIDWGDENGETIYYDRSVNSSVEYLQRAYPGTVVAYKHAASDPLLGVIRENWSNGTGKDASRAKSVLNRIRASNSFPRNGTIYADEGMTNRDARNLMMGSDGAFDAWVMILPRGNATGTTHYFAAHGMPNKRGYHWNYSAAVGSLEVRSDTTTDALHAMITAQEIGHRYSDGLYTSQFARGPSDQRHVTGSVESVGYDFNDGTYNLVNDFEIRDGAFSHGSLRPPPTVRKHQSYMDSAAQAWADSWMHRYFIDGNYTTGYSGGQPKQPECHQPPEAPRPTKTPEAVIEVHANTDGDAVDIDSSDSSVSIPDELREEIDQEMHPEATSVEITLEGPDGEELVATTVPDRTTGSHGERVHESIDVSLPFPTRAVRFLASRNGGTASMNPIVHPLESALGRIPERGFDGDPETARDRLREQLHGVDAQMVEGDYAGAHDHLVEFEEGLSETVRAEYESYAYQPDRSDLLDRTEPMLERLSSLAEANTDGTDRAITLQLPDGSARSVQPVQADQPVEEYYGYDTGPSDSSNTPDDLETNDATVTFLYLNAATDELSLVVLNGDATASSDGGGKVVLTIEGAAGAEWRVQDGPPGSGFGDFDAYTTEDGPIGESESVIWGWDDSKTDGGAVGPLGGTFDVEVVHRAAGTVRDRSGERSGIDSWLFVDGKDMQTPVELASFGGETGDVSVRITSEA